VIAAAGRGALLDGLLAAAGAVFFWWRAARLQAGEAGPAGRDYRVARARGRFFTALAALGALAACAALEVALISDDFAVSYVAANGSRHLPLLYKVTALWAALQGSLLLWLLMLTALAVAVMFGSERAAGQLHPWAMAVIAGVAAFFSGLALFTADPFTVISPAPANGPGPNPLLQDNPLITAHPPLLYLGFTGMTVPFAYAIAALVTGRTGPAWLAVTRRWTLVAWTALTVAVVLGGFWSYTVLGWGGYWAWDPVENAAILPWFTATALLHSMMTQTRRAALQAWNLALAIATFLLVLLGTFLTRSGVVESVHSFTQSSLGPVLLGFLIAVLAGSGTLLVLRVGRLGAEPGLPPALSRETVFLGNNLLLAGLALTVLVGTVYPALAQALTGNQLSVGAPYFDRMTVPLALAVILLMGVGPLVPWVHAQPARLGRRLAVPSAAGAAATGALGVAGLRGLAPLATFGLAAFVLTAIAGRVAAGAAAERRRGAGVLAAPWRAVARRRRFFAGMLVHAGVVLAAVAIAASSAYTTATQATLRPGQAVRLSGYTATLQRITRQDGPRRDTITAVVTLRHHGRPAGELRPALSTYPTAAQAIGTPAIRPGLAGDAYLVLEQADPAGRWAVIGLSVHPLVDWLWIGAAVMAAGALAAAWPDRRRRLPAPPRGSPAATLAGTRP